MAYCGSPSDKRAYLGAEAGTSPKVSPTDRRRLVLSQRSGAARGGHRLSLPPSDRLIGRVVGLRGQISVEPDTLRH